MAKAQEKKEEIHVVYVSKNTPHQLAETIQEALNKGYSILTNQILEESELVDSFLRQYQKSYGVFFVKYPQQPKE